MLELRHLNIIHHFIVDTKFFYDGFGSDAITCRRNDVPMITCVYMVILGE
ncbi:hypothetical protein [Blochmannia endosymbiont of Camponotus sp.]|nr:hypothetical protein [Blochmannia endosymbiont of Camponotus sp.]URJ23930.1 hypothetical protein M9403_00150 [Blochmannia endosymbiont of Camponotus sp.]